MNETNGIAKFKNKFNSNFNTDLIDLTNEVTIQKVEHDSFNLTQINMSYDHKLDNKIMSEE